MVNEDNRFIKTRNGNKSLSFQAFKEEVLKHVKFVEMKTLQEAYKRLSHYCIHSIKDWGKDHWTYTDVLRRCIRKDAREHWIALYVTLSYDVPLGCLCPQDCPYETLLIDTNDGECYTSTQIYEYQRESKKEK